MAGLPGKCTAPVQTQLQLVFLLKSHQTNHRLGVRGSGHSLAVHHRLSGLRLALRSRGSLSSLENVDVVWGPPASSGSDPAGWVRLQPIGGLMALAAPWPLPHLSEGPQRPCSCWGCLVPRGSPVGAPCTERGCSPQCSHFPEVGACKAPQGCPHVLCLCWVWVVPGSFCRH